MIKKKIGTFLCALTVALSSYAFADTTLNATAPQQKIVVQLDGENIDFTDSEGNVADPQIIKNRTMVPMRKIFEEFDADVEWDEATKTVIATTDTKEISLTIDSTTSKVKDVDTGAEKTITLDQAPTIRNNRTLVPVRFIAESLDKEVGWDNDNKTVIIIDFSKFEEDLANSVPELEKLFSVKFDEMKSFKSKTKLTGEVSFTDSNNSTNDESLAINGTLDMAVDKSEQVDMELALDVKGEGSTVDTLKDSGYEGLYGRLFLSKDKVLVGIKKDGVMTWQDLSSSIKLTMSEFALMNKSELSISSYQDFIKTVKEMVGPLDVTSYEKLSKIFSSLDEILNEVELTEAADGTQTLSLNIALADSFDEVNLQKFGQGQVDNLELNVILSVKDGKIVKDETKIAFGLSSDEGQSMELSIDSDSTYSNVNEDFTLQVPSL